MCPATSARAMLLSSSRANNSFKPKPLRYTKGMAEKACHAFGSTTRFGLTQALARSKIHLCRPAFIPAFCPSQRFGLWGLAVAPGFACNHCAGFKPFWPLAPVPRALAALSLVAFRGCAALFQTPSGLTRRSSRSAFGGRLTSFVRKGNKNE